MSRGCGPQSKRETSHAIRYPKTVVVGSIKNRCRGPRGVRGDGADGGPGAGPVARTEPGRGLADLQPRPGGDALLAPRPDQHRQRRRTGGSLVVPLPSRGRLHRGPEPGGALPAGDADRGGRRHVPGRRQPRGRPAARNRRGDLAARAERGAGVVPRRRLRAGHRCTRGPHLFHQPVEGHRPEGGDRRARRRVRRRRRGGAAHPLHGRAGCLRRHPDPRIERLRSGTAAHRASPEPAAGWRGADSCLAAGYRRGDRRPALGIPDPTHGERLRQRDLGQSELAQPHREQRLGVHAHRRRGARPRLHARQQPGVELLRRRPPRRQPLRKLHHRHRHPERRARVVLSEHPPRAVGLQPAAGARPARHRARRRGHSRRRAGR